MSLPPVTLFIGPDPDTAFDAAAMFASADAGGYRREMVVIPPGTLNAGRAKEVIYRSNLLPEYGYTVICMSLDGCNDVVQHSLLKTLEEPVPGVRFVLSAVAPLPTVTSRAEVRRAGLPDEAPGWQEDVKPSVCSAVAAASAGDQRKLARVTRDWSWKHVTLLEVWAAESFTGRFRVFSRADSLGYPAVAARAVLSALDQYAGARPRIAAQAALASLPRR